MNSFMDIEGGRMDDDRRGRDGEDATRCCGLVHVDSSTPMNSSFFLGSSFFSGDSGIFFLGQSGQSDNITTKFVNK